MSGQSDDESKSFRERVEEIRQERQQKREARRAEDASPMLRQRSEELASGAKTETVTPSRLRGDEQYFENIIPFLEQDEQPHYLYPLTEGIFADDALAIESGAERETILSNTDGGSVVISNICTRIISAKGEWTIPFNSITSVDFVGHPALHIQTSGRTYYIKIAGTFFDEEKSLSEAATFIRQMQRDSTDGDSFDHEDSMEKLERLGELHEKGVLTDKEFREKKTELLDDI